MVLCVDMCIVLKKKNNAIIVYNLQLVFFSLEVLSHTENDIRPPVIMNLSIYPIESVRFCFLYFETILLVSYIFRITITSQ